ncbi:hypothetical protein M9H77_17551 [Catharanthus roseus]|uniref:Uncharacterized protein n=1 Tax=Catharanthus roseus TaxID=4058 RepID=A0ACC0B4X0_CATRO|nr:hypothetical protein M9H77_17551 [Catharanthus roseus]
MLSYPVSIAGTHPLAAHEPIEVHGWSLSARASEALSHQSFAIPWSLKAANVTLRASSYLRFLTTRHSNHEIFHYRMRSSLWTRCVLPSGFRLSDLRILGYDLVRTVRRS